MGIIQMEEAANHSSPILDGVRFYLKRSLG